MRTCDFFVSLENTNTDLVTQSERAPRLLFWCGKIESSYRRWKYRVERGCQTTVDL